MSENKFLTTALNNFFLFQHYEKKCQWLVWFLDREAWRCFFLLADDYDGAHQDALVGINSLYTDTKRCPLDFPRNVDPFRDGFRDCGYRVIPFNSWFDEHWWIVYLEAKEDIHFFSVHGTNEYHASENAVDIFIDYHERRLAP